MFCLLDLLNLFLFFLDESLGRRSDHMNYLTNFGLAPHGASGSEVWDELFSYLCFPIASQNKTQAGYGKSHALCTK